MVIDLFSLALGAAPFALAWLTSEKRRRRAIQMRKLPYCACDHSLADHDPQTKACHAQIQRESKWDRDGAAREWIWVPCTCRQYVGPEPLSSLWVPPLSLPEKDG